MIRTANKRSISDQFISSDRKKKYANPITNRIYVSYKSIQTK